jgi:putative NIF3 family GTP cyclohydrolase 1 type 2
MAKNKDADTRSRYPEELADRRWDNVGLLVDNTEQDSKKHKPVVMLTNDLTFQVAVDAIGQGASVIVSYRELTQPYVVSWPFSDLFTDPFIFSGLKSITNKDPQQATLLYLAKAGVAVYCPHTAVDAAPEGLNAWLADIVAGEAPATRTFASPCTTAPESHSPAGYGTIGHFSGEKLSLTDILRRLATKLGGLKHLMIASPVGADIKTTKVGSFAVCAGSGYDVLKGADVDLLVTGETSHHSALRAIQQGRTLVQVFHSNSERGYLRDVLRPKLRDELRQSVPEADVLMSEFDADPFRIYSVEDLS